MNLLVPLFIPFITAVLCLAWWKDRRVQGWLSVAGLAVMAGTALRLLFSVRADGIQVVRAGGWDAPFGIVLAADLLSAGLVATTAMIGLVVTLYSIPAVDVKREAYGYYPLINLLVFGVTGAFLAGDIFNLYVWFEVMLMSSFVLLALGGEKRQLEGAIMYVTINFLSSAIFLAGVGVLYSLTGTLNFADLAIRLGEVPEKGLVTVVAMFFLVSFGIKAAVFPLFFWLPASYHTPPIAVAAIFSGLLTKVGVYALMRVFTLLFVHDIPYTHTMLMVIAAMTMFAGVLGAAAQGDLRRILSFSIVSQIGYMVMGIALFTPLALAGAVFFLVHNMVVKTSLFLISGIVHHVKGSFKLRYIGGVYRDHFWLSILFLVAALSLAGLPPFSGFWAKFILMKAGIEAGEFWLVLVVIGSSLMTLYYLTRIWNEVFWTNRPEAVGDPEPHTPGPGPLWLMVLPVALLTAITLAIGLHAEPIFELARETADQLLGRDEYINTVLGR
ncbi:MAG: Na+/H+ antiporter subunit D [Flavobacteriales bacterium]|nr:Na+/H+ antiporter subunit D [Flavobacteriales bacterium]